MQIKTWRYVLRDKQEPARFYKSGAIVSKEDMAWTDSILNARLITQKEYKIFQNIIAECDSLNDLYLEKVDFTIEYDN